jgi:hypothetical protein
MKVLRLPIPIQKLTISFLRGKDLNALRLVNKKISDLATEVLLDFFKQGKIKLSEKFFEEIVNKKIRMTWQLDINMTYFLIYEIEKGPMALSVFDGGKDVKIWKDPSPEKSYVVNRSFPKFTLCYSTLWIKKFFFFNDLVNKIEEFKEDRQKTQELINDPEKFVLGDMAVLHFELSAEEMCPIKKNAERILKISEVK